uniref:Uncharacterized protein n=1 Tax=Vespula pensylvanica TaxID=30213 RepID=A0A834PFB2_VESPE|nr:hypothetical protein H0235_001065 [Vespula pensylvanica]
MCMPVKYDEDTRPNISRHRPQTVLIRVRKLNEPSPTVFTISIIGRIRWTMITVIPIASWWLFTLSNGHILRSNKRTWRSYDWKRFAMLDHRASSGIIKAQIENSKGWVNWFISAEDRNTMVNRTFVIYQAVILLTQR